MKSALHWAGVGLGLILAATVFAGTIRLVRVIDGDTLVISDQGREEEVRLLRINAPERGEPGYAEAKQFLAELAGSGEIELEFEGEERDAYHRLLAYVKADGKDLNLAMVRAGMARFDKANGEGRYGDQFRAAEAEAKAGGRGIWKAPAAPDLYRDWWCSSKNSSIYHPCSCPTVKTIEPANIIRYRTEEEAKRDRKVHCKCANFFTSRPSAQLDQDFPTMEPHQVRQFLGFLDYEIGRLEQEKNRLVKEGKTELAEEIERELEVLTRVKREYLAILGQAE
jgi:micrococcal nuclease